MHPYLSLLAESYAPVSDTYLSVESLGSGVGIGWFCSERDIKKSGIVMSSRPMKEKEILLCHRNGIYFNEYLLGYDSVVLIKNLQNPLSNITPVHFYEALSAETLDSSNSCSITLNEKKSWKDVDVKLPDVLITVYGPSESHGTFSVLFDKLLLEGLRQHPCYNSIDHNLRKEAESSLRLRTDAWHAIDINYASLETVLLSDFFRSSSIAVVSYSLFYALRKIYSPLLISGFFPNEENVLNKKYILYRPLYLYYRNEHKESSDFVQYISSLPLNQSSLARYGLFFSS